MTFILRQSTADDVLIGPFLDLTDGATAETGESPSVKLSKNGQTMAAKSDVTTPVHDADGYYNCELDATDTGTVGTVVLTVAASANALPVRHEIQIIEEAAYDLLYAAGATGGQSIADLILPPTNTIYNDIPFLMVDSTDFTTPETGLTVTATRSIDGGTTFSATTGTVTEAANGIYHFDASAADMNGKIITFKFSATGAMDTFVVLTTSE